MSGVASQRAVLLVDDENIPTTYYLRALERAGFIVVRTKSTEEALSAARARLFDLVILDMMMPPGAYDDRSGGLNTGVFLLADIRKEQTKARFMMLTNVTNEQKLEEIRECEPTVVIAPKAEYPPNELVELALKVLSPAVGEND
jgi:CheY-like chemotaxis protein